MQRVFETLKDPIITETYPSIRKSSMRRSATGNYTINLSVILTQEAISGEVTAPVATPTTGIINTTK